MTKRSQTHWRVAEFDGGQPFIVLEPFAGDDLNLFAKTITFDLPKGTTLEEAQEIARTLSRTLIAVGETG